MDIIGDTLSVVVIVKLPFNVPTEPIFAARCELFEEPFKEFSIPRATIRFKQGFGRLIRTKNDRGVVVVLDKRLQTKSYASSFLESIPQCTLVRGPSSNLRSAIKEWLKKV